MRLRKWRHAQNHEPAPVTRAGADRPNCVSPFRAAFPSGLFRRRQMAAPADKAVRAVIRFRTRGARQACGTTSVGKMMSAPIRFRRRAESSNKRPRLLVRTLLRQARRAPQACGTTPAGSVCAEIQPALTGASSAEPMRAAAHDALHRFHAPRHIRCQRDPATRAHEVAPRIIALALLRMRFGREYRRRDNRSQCEASRRHALSLSPIGFLPHP